MSKSEKTTKILFWFAFGAFLATSIPHVAWVFFQYEPQHDGYGWVWWILSYAVAIGIDVLICWLSYMRVEQSQQGKGDGFITWLFIALLALLSWFCNWLFAETMAGVNVWRLSIPYIGRVGTLTPFIVSALPLFVIAYSYMSRRILGAKSKAVSVDELKKAAEDAEQIAGYQTRIATVKKQRRDVTIDNTKDTLKKIIPWSKKAVLPAISTPSILPEDNGIENGMLSEETQPKIQEQNTEEIEAIAVRLAGTQENDALPEEEEQSSITPPVSNRSTGKLSISVKEAAALLHLSESYVRELKQKGRLKSPSRNKRLITIASIKNYQVLQQKPVEDQGDTVLSSTEGMDVLPEL